ncbi:hypothetical protein F511_45914 [Dorcoceras hygrometricum]|uniref:Uncharacterized protein n=1 Tax=Dorcoceras hygrometricum TaxID=472368 RepID=A0A2Z6ZUW4_9LAMI|nr:hypothetical protein F511_45914 [Dorcoceras hygrometricum]
MHQPVAHQWAKPAVIVRQPAACVGHNRATIARNTAATSRQPVARSCMHRPAESRPPSCNQRAQQHPPCSDHCANPSTSMREGSNNQSRKIVAKRRPLCAVMRGEEGAAAHGGGRRPLQQFFFIRSEKQRLDAIMATIVLKDPSHSSDTTVG